MKIKYVELHYKEDIVSKHKLDHTEGDTKFYFTMCNKEYCYDCTTRSLFKKVIFFWIHQRNMKVEYAVFLGDEN